MLYLGILRALLAAPAENHRDGTYHGRERVKKNTVVTRISGATLIKIFEPQMRRLFEGGA